MFVTGSPFIDVKPFDTVHMAHSLPRVYKFHNIFNFNKNEKQSLYRPGKSARVTGVWGSQDF